MACKVKASKSSSNRLMIAGAAVRKAAATLVEAAESADKRKEADVDHTSGLSDSAVSGIRAEIAAKEAILKQERELEKARRVLSNIRAAKYSQRK